MNMLKGRKIILIKILTRVNVKYREGHSIMKLKIIKLLSLWNIEFKLLKDACMILKLHVVHVYLNNFNIANIIYVFFKSLILTWDKFRNFNSFLYIGLFGKFVPINLYNLINVY